MAHRFSEIIDRVYPNGVLREGPDRVEFHSPDQVVFMMWPVETLSDQKKTVLRNMRLPKHTPILRMAYKFLAMLPYRSCCYIVFWLSNDEHVRAMFASHGRILTDQVMQLYVQILDTWTATLRVGPSDLAPEVDALMTADPVDVVLPPENTGESDHFHTLDVDAMEEERLTDIGSRDNDYDLDGGIELRVEHRFFSREAVLMGGKNYSIRQATKYKVLESDSMKYHCACKQSANGCPWRVRVAYRVNL
ncbi:hypothetical protein PIB30_048084 [Stylosanthes scabra]|uniref:Transposase MuDR plant domain-containing protein n=1 Tax=Stylosanthes scabra TaxID=79078 RepID=A0ABU6VFA6_9FABA|nr:hypothetical protein [Stylosanthes scabra]